MTLLVSHVTPTALRLSSAFACAGMVLAGCTHAVRTTTPPRTHVAYQTVDTANTRRYVLRPGESSTQPKLIDHPAPAYPDSMIALHLPHVVVAAKVIVDAAGTVTAVQLAPADPLHDAAFDQAVRLAVSQWRYTPLQILRWRDEFDANGDLTGSHQVATESRPFSLDYEFHFDLRDGNPVVASTQATAK